jgi:hypothetical protein
MTIEADATLGATDDRKAKRNVWCSHAPARSAARWRRS